MDIVMEIADSEFHQIHFGGNAILHYDRRIPFLVVGMREGMTESAANEFMNGCLEFKNIHRQVFDAGNYNFKKIPLIFR